MQEVGNSTANEPPVKHLKRNWLAFVLAWVDNIWDAFVFRIKQWLNLFAPMRFVLYRGFGSPEMGLWVRGRLLANHSIRASTPSDTRFGNMVRMIRRFRTTEIGHAKLKVTLDNQVVEVITDHEGYFTAQLNFPVPSRLEPGATADQISPGLSEVISAAPTEILKAKVELISARIASKFPVVCEAEVQIAMENAQYGVISDIDDTILASHATDRLRMARTVFFKNAMTRKVYEGVAEFYQRLKSGNDQTSCNPLFYVSSSPWNLHEFLVEFLTHNKIPLGPLMLRDIGFERVTIGARDHDSHKLTQIRQIFDVHPKLPFILIGDTGQRDPEIYERVAMENPGRILAIYLREVKLRGRSENVKRLAETLSEQGVPMLLISHTSEVVADAVARGFILAD